MVRIPARSLHQLIFVIFYSFNLFLVVAWVYILYSEKINKYYVGACTDLDRRLYEHNLGHSKFTSTGVPWELVYCEEFEDLVEAKRRETKIKKMKSRTYIEALINSGNQ